MDGLGEAAGGGEAVGLGQGAGVDAAALERRGVDAPRTLGGLLAVAPEGIPVAQVVEHEVAEEEQHEGNDGGDDRPVECLRQPGRQGEGLDLLRLFRLRPLGLVAAVQHAVARLLHLGAVVAGLGKRRGNGGGKKQAGEQ